MYFHASTEATILFQEWTTTSWQGKNNCFKNPRDKHVGNVGSDYLVDNEEIFVHS